jgi:hypothetical protein
LGGDLLALLDLGAGVLLGPAGRGLPGGNSLFFASPKKSKQKKGDPTAWVPALRFGQPAMPEKNGGPRKLAALKQRAALIPLFSSITGPARTGYSGNEVRTAEQPNSHRARISVQSQTVNATNLIAGSAIAACARGTFDTKTGDCCVAFLCVFLLPPLGEGRDGGLPESAPASPVLTGPVMTGKSGIRAARCLSRRRVCAAPRFCRSAQVARSEAQGPRMPGRFFFGDFLLAKQKKVTGRRATPGLNPQLQQPRLETSTRSNRC